jgi:hypothetical protein
MLMRTRDIKETNEHSEFAPLELVRAEELKRLINLSASQANALVIEPGAGVKDTAVVDLISPNEKTNALLRFQRHY